jgi:hypothetical protein
VLIVGKSRSSSSIAILAALFAIISIIPPVDAFTISRNSQTSRAVTILERNSMLSGDKIVPKSAIPDEDKAELTNIMNYLNSMGHTSRIAWLPKDYLNYRDFRNVFGFDEYYRNIPYSPDTPAYYNANCDQSIPFDVSGYDIMLRPSFYSKADGSKVEYSFTYSGRDFILSLSDSANKGNVVISVREKFGKELVSTSLNPFMEKIVSDYNTSGKMIYTPSDATIEASGESIRLKAVVSSIGFRKTGSNPVFEEINGELMVLLDFT